MADSDRTMNPFDFRSPTRSPADLVGREVQMRWLVRSLESLEQRQPRHALVVGPPGYGKTSLLNAYADEAEKAGFLPVRFRLNDSVVSSGEASFEALLTAAMLALESTGDIS